MPRTKEQNAALRAATVTKIHAAAVALFTEKGYAAASVEDIAGRAGISSGLMYRHYRTKQALYGALVEEAAQGLDGVAARLRFETDPRTAMLTLTQEILTDLQSGDAFGRVLLLVMHAFTMEKALDAIRTLRTSHAGLIAAAAELIRRGQQAGQFRPGNAAAMAQFYFAAIQGLAETKFALREDFQPPPAGFITAFLFREDDDGT